MSQRAGSSNRPRERIPVSATRQAWATTTAREFRRSTTASEAILWEHLRGRRLSGYRFRRQQPIGPYVADFFCSTAGLIVEVDGAVHDQQQEYDLERQA